MPWFDLPEAELRTYRTATREPEGLDDWWRARLGEARAAAAPITLRRHQPELYGPTEVYDVEFSGARGDRIRGWYLRPAGAGRIPVVVEFVGYGGGRGMPVEHLALPAIGLAVFVMDTRGQGGNWTVGATGDPGRDGDGPEFPGVMTRGIATPETYYYTRLFVDAARAVEEVAQFDGVDPARLAVAGTSQGGGMALAAAALVPHLVALCQAQVPFLCDLQRAITLTPAHPYQEIARFLAQHEALVPAALNTLRYVDAALLATRITADCLFAVGLMDDVCPPSTVFAAYNAVPAPTSRPSDATAGRPAAAGKEIVVYPFGVHSVPPGHWERRVAHLLAHFGS